MLLVIICFGARVNKSSLQLVCCCCKFFYVIESIGCIGGDSIDASCDSVVVEKSIVII